MAKESGLDAAFTPIKFKRGRKSGTVEIPVEAARTLLGIYNRQASALRKANMTQLSAPIKAFCQAINEPLPENVNSWKAGLQKGFDRITTELGGQSVLLHFTGTDQESHYAPNDTTIIAFEPIDVEARRASLGKRKKRTAKATADAAEAAAQSAEASGSTQ